MRWLYSHRKIRWILLEYIEQMLFSITELRTNYILQKLVKKRYYEKCISRVS